MNDLADRLGVERGTEKVAEEAIVYSYRDRDSTPLFEVVRFPGKRFAQRKPGAKDWGVEGVKLVPYHLPELLTSHPDVTVFIVEGEKDVERLERYGAVATCNPMGAGKWRPEYNGYLRGRTVVVVEDNDDQGRRHAADVAGQLQGVAARVSTSDLRLLGVDKPGWDISDYLDSGGSIREVERTAVPYAAAKERVGYVTAEAAYSDSSPLPPSLLTGLRHFDVASNGGLRGGQLVIIAARPGVGKSALCAGIAHSLSLRGEKVGIFSLEMGSRQVARRIACYGEWEPGTIFIDESMSYTVSSLVKQARLIHKAEGGLSLIIVDYVQLMAGESRGGGENRVNDVGNISRRLKMLARELDIPVVALSQLNRSIETRSKKNREPRLSDLRESGSLEQDADIVIFLDREELNDPTTSLRGVAICYIKKHRDGPVGNFPLGFDAPGIRFYDLQETADTPDGPVGQREALDVGNSLEGGSDRPPF